MATHLSGSGQYYSRTTGLPSIAGYTMMGWFRPGQNTTWAGWLVFGSGSSVYYSCGQDSSGKFDMAVNGNFTPGSGVALTNGTWYHAAVTVFGTSGANALAYLNGALTSSEAAVSMTGSTIMVGNTLGGDNDYFTGDVAYVKVYDAVLTAAEILQEMRQGLPFRTANLNAFYPMLSVSDDEKDFSGAGNTSTVTGTPTDIDGPPIPWRQGRQRLIYIPSGGSGAAYTLTAAQGSYTLTGQTAGLVAARKISATQGSYALTGQVVGLKFGHRLVAAVGSYALTGQSAALRAARIISAVQGAYALTGQSAGLKYGHVLTAIRGLYSLTGEDAGLAYSGAAKVLAAAFGAFVLTGQPAQLRAARRMLAAAGIYSLIGQAAGLSGGILVVIEAAGLVLIPNNGALSLIPNDGRLSLAPNNGTLSLAPNDGTLLIIPDQ